VPWQGFSLLGTGDALYTGDPDGYRITDEEIALLLEELKTAYASPLIDREHVLAAFGGLRPVDRIVHERVSRGDGAEFGSVEAARRDRIEWSAGNLLTVEGIKYTTVRDVAEKVGDRVTKRLSRCGALAPCRTRQRVLPGGEVGGFTDFLQRAAEEFSAVASPEVIRYLATTYGTRYRAIAERIRREPELGTPFQGSKVTPAELLCAAESEMVCTLTDVVMRRTALGVTGLVPEPELRRAGELVGAALGWEPRRLDEELHHLRAAFLRGHHLHSPPRHAAAPR
jgi:glycerol-3-phosphate dehydrogenase